MQYRKSKQAEKGLVISKRFKNLVGLFLLSVYHITKLVVKSSQVMENKQSQVKSSFEKYWTIDHIGGTMVWSLKNVNEKLDGHEYDLYLADYNYIQQLLKRMLGKVLTIVDASIPEGRQNKSVKDIIRNEFIEEYVHLSEQLQDNKAIQDYANEYTSNMTDEEVEKLMENAADLEEVAGA